MTGTITRWHCDGIGPFSVLSAPVEPMAPLDLSDSEGGTVVVPTTAAGDPNDLVAGIDTHTDTHTLAILTTQGQTVTTGTFTADGHGYSDLITVLQDAGTIAIVGVEGTNSYGAGLTRALVAAGFTVAEVLRPARQVRRMRGKSDPIDAIEAARTVLAGQGISVAKDTATPAEALRFLLGARIQLIAATTAIGNSITSLLVTAPEPLRAKFRGLSTAEVLARLATSRPVGPIDSPHTAALLAMRTLAKAHQDSTARAKVLEDQLRSVLTEHYPALLAIYGAGVVVAAQLAVTVGGNPHRIRNEAALASLCGAAPIPASSGRTTRHRLNRGGDRRANAALHRIALVRMQHDQRTKDYVAGRTAEGKSNREIMRCLKRAICREVYRALTNPQEQAPRTDFQTIRQSKGLTLARAAEALHTWPARIRDIEKQRRPLPELTTRYEQWLTAV